VSGALKGHADGVEQRRVTRIQVDFNSVDRHGFVVGLLEDADGPIEVGDIVVTFDAEGMECEADVVTVEEGRDFCRLAPLWPEPERG
jgi:hypothetical protein